MKNRIILAAAIIGLLATSCKKENTEPQQAELMQSYITINATYKTDNGEKVDYTENENNITATWESGDQILVAYDGHVSTLTLQSGAGTSSATFSGEITYTNMPTANSVLSCYVRDANNQAALTIDGDNIVYSDAAFLAQNGTLAGAGKCNTYMGMATYGDGTNITCNFGVNTSILKLRCFATADGVSTDATLTYKSGSTELAKATFEVGETNGENTIYLAVPAGAYSGAQTLVYQSGSAEVIRTLSEGHATFADGQTYSKTLFFGPVNLGILDFDYTAQNGDVLTGALANRQKITIAAGATVTLSDATINLTANTTSAEQASGYSALTCLGDATILLADGTTNTLNELYYYWAIIQPGPTGTTLTIDGTGTLNATTGNSNSGYSTVIGAGYNTSCGNIVIAGGTVNATSNYYGIAIGAGYSNSYASNLARCGNITITGGEVNAQSKNGSSAIGTTQHGDCGDITITGGTVTAKLGNSGTCIGSCKGKTCGNITISGGNVTATYISSVSSNTSLVGIGAASGYNSYTSVCGDILINGGTVTATVSSGSNSGASPAIGCSHVSSTSQPNQCGSITITSAAHVTATRGTYSANRCIGKNTGSTYSTINGTITVNNVVFYENGAYTTAGEAALSGTTYSNFQP